MYTNLSSHVCIIRYTNNTYVLLQMLQVSLQHCCWASYQIVEQVTIVNLVALLRSWGIVLDNDLESNIGGLVPGRVLNLWRLLHMLRHFEPPFPGLWSVCMASTPIFEQKWEKKSYFDPFFVKIWQYVLFWHSFWPFVEIRVNGRCWASLSSWHSQVSVSVRKRVRGQK